MSKKIVIAPQKGKQSLAMKMQPDVMIYGGAAGSGKSRVLLMKPLPYINDPNFAGLIFRRTKEVLKLAGGPWMEAKKLYHPLIYDDLGKEVGNSVVRNRDYEVVFPSGAIQKFSGLEREGDEEKNFQGTQWSFIGFDEL